MTFWFQSWENLTAFDRSNTAGSIDVKMDRSVFEEKLCFKTLVLIFSSKFDRVSYIISIAKTASKKIRALIRSMKFLPPEVALYLCISTIRPCMEYYCHIWAGATSCFLELLDKLQKRIWRTVGSSLSTSLEPLAYRRNVASLSLFYRYYFGRCSSELAQLVPYLSLCVCVCMCVCVCVSVCVYMYIYDLFLQMSQNGLAMKRSVKTIYNEIN